MTGRWLSVRLEIDAEYADALSDAFAQLGAISVDLADARAGTPDESPVYGEPGEPPGGGWRHAAITVLLAAGCDPADLVRRASRAAGLPLAPPFQVDEVEEQDWVRLTQSQFDPIRVSERLWVTPTWHEPPVPGAVNLRLDPGLAFGTGSHPTTRLCLRWLDAVIRGGEHVLDYGSGSGILAIAALKLGAAGAVGVDIDSQAVAASRENARMNDVAARFHPAAEPNPFQAEIVVANILANPLKILAPSLAAAVVPGGRLALSGILRQQAPAVIDVYRPWIELSVWAEEDGWVCLAGTKPGQRARWP